MSSEKNNEGALKEKIEKEKLEKHQKIISDNLEKLEKLKEKNESNNAKEKLELYEQIIKYNNINENYILNYLLLIKETENKETFISKLNKFHVCLSDNAYNSYFNNHSRKNARTKIKDYLKFLCEYKGDNKKYEDDTIPFDYYGFISKIFDLQQMEKIVDFHSNKIVRWDNNEELYLYTLYISLINSIISIMEYYMNDKSVLKKLSTNKEYLSMEESLQKLIAEDKEEEKSEKAQTINKEKKANKEKRKFLITFFKNSKNSLILRKGNFYREYYINLKGFLLKIKDNFNKRFGDLNLKAENDKIIFEHFLHFISSYLFTGKEAHLTKKWKEILNPLNNTQKIDIVNIYNKNSISNYLINLNPSCDKLVIKHIISEQEIVIDNLDKYAFEYLIDLLNHGFNEKFLDWYLNSSLKPDRYKTDLFVCKKRDIWKKLLINIFNSESFNYIKTSFYKYNQIDFFAIDEVISRIIDDIQFFLFNSVFYGKTIKDSLRIYEYGLYKEDMPNKSIALLIFYGFHIVLNLHEIGGHFYVRFQYIYSLNEGFESPKIEEGEKELYTLNGIGRGKESGEKVEITFFGSVIKGLTIKEALYILNLKNYNQDVKKFRENFLNCNKKDIKQIIDPSLEKLLKELDIVPEDLCYENTNINNERFYRQDNNRNVYLFSNPRHPIEFYCKKEECLGALEIIAKKLDIKEYINKSSHYK